MPLIFDIETNGLLDEGTKIHCLVIKDLDPRWTYGPLTFHREMDRPERWIEHGLKQLMEADLILGHNIIKFDIPFIQRIYPWFQPKGIVRDTIVCTRLIWPNLKDLDFDYARKHKTTPLMGKHSLEAWGQRIGEHKAKIETDWSEFTPQMLEYCAQDVNVTAKLWDKIKSKNHSEQAIQIEHDFARFIFLQEQHGFRLDIEAAHKLHATLGQRRLVIERELQAIIPGWYETMKTPQYYTAASGEQFSTKTSAGKQSKSCVAGPMKVKHTAYNPGSRDHTSRFLIEAKGWKPKAFGSDGKPTLNEDILETLNYPEIPKIMEYLMVEKRLGQVAEGREAWLKLEKKGRVHGEVNPMGTVTSRCSHSHPNMGQVVATDKPFGKESRALFTADPGCVLVGADASGIQLRALAHYLDRWDHGQYVQLVTRGDPHAANQKAAGLPTRDTAKTFIYAWLLGAGDPKIGAIIGKGAAAGRQLKERFLANLPAFQHLKDALEVRVKESGSIKGLDGRIMPVKTAHFALASLLQGFEAVVMKLAGPLFFKELTSKGFIHGKDFGLNVMVHDEYQVSAKKEIADEVGKTIVQAITRAGEVLGSKCPLAGEYKIGANWCETH